MTTWTAAAIFVGVFCTVGLLIIRYGKASDTPEDIKALRRINTDTVAGRKRYLARAKQIAADRLKDVDPDDGLIEDIDPRPYQRRRR